MYPRTLFRELQDLVHQTKRFSSLPEPEPDNYVISSASVPSSRSSARQRQQSGNTERKIFASRRDRVNALAASNDLVEEGDVIYKEGKENLICD